MTDNTSPSFVDLIQDDPINRCWFCSARPAIEGAEEKVQLVTAKFPGMPELEERYSIPVPRCAVCLSRHERQKRLNALFDGGKGGFFFLLTAVAIVAGIYFKATVLWVTGCIGGLGLFALALRSVFLSSAGGGAKSEDARPRAYLHPSVAAAIRRGAAPSDEVIDLTLLNKIRDGDS